MSIGNLREFDVKAGVWASYIDRLEMYFLVNKVEDKMKVPILIASMGDEAYQLLENLASPDKPATLSLYQINEFMRCHLQPSPSALAERYRFRQRRQNIAENISIYVAELKKLSRNCKFENMLNENLRDQFVCGLRSDVMRQRLFAENDDLSFTEAVRIATSLEAAERDSAAVEKMEVAADTTETNIHAVAPERRRAGRGGRQRWRDVGAAARPLTRHAKGGANDSCEACGAQNHSSSRCEYRDFICSKCKCKGHLRRVCPERESVLAKNSWSRRKDDKGIYFGDVVGSESSGEDDEHIEQELHHLCLSDYKACKIPILIDNKEIIMEVDTGSAISCISKATYEEYFSHLHIRENDVSIVLRFYDGSKLRPSGIIKPIVRYGNREKALELFIIEGGTTSLLGRHWLSELRINIPNFNVEINQLTIDNAQIKLELSNLLHRFKELFSGGLGRYTGGKATLRVREGAAPVFHRARPLPYALRERVDAELDAMLSAGIIEPVDCSDWASPLVPINKPDGTLRICADYKATLNPALLIDRYPLPKIEDVLVGLNGAQYFSKMDLSQAYNQIELDESKLYTVINTHRGLFRYNRLVFGLASSVGIFQRIMSNLVQGIPHVQVFLDDIIIGGKTKEEHLAALEKVLQRLQQAGLKLKENKCVFLVDEIKYLGSIVSKDGIKADKSKIEAISKIPKPVNVTELRSFLGLVNFFAKFVRNISFVLNPLYSLLHKGVEWNWNDRCDRSFNEVKRLLTSSSVLAHYSPGRAVVVTCDASAAGVGGVLAQPDDEGRERPVAYVSRALTPAEKNYSQIHKEALAIIFCMKKFHQYLYGRKFLLRTDHKPLVSIFGPHKGIPTMTASRMQRWAVILSGYDYDIEYIKTSDNCADGLSRLPIKYKQAEHVIPEQTYLHFAQEALLLNYNIIKKQTSNDPILGRVLSYVRDGWPAQCDITGIQPYFNRQHELYEELGCVMWGHRVIIPEKCRVEVLKMIHEPHMGIVKSKALARSYVWWPGLDEAVETTCRTCTTCAALAAAPERQLPHPWPRPARPWSRLHLDFMGPLHGKTYLVVIDAMSKWLEIFSVPSTSASCTIPKLRELWSRWGLPKQIVTDNGPPFTSNDFEVFLKRDGIDHVFTAPYHPSSNGAAENAVKTLKMVIKKAVLNNKSIDEILVNFLLHYRNTEHSSTGESPAMLLMGRRLRTRLDILKPDRELRTIRSQHHQVKNAGGTDRQLAVGENVWYRKFLKEEKWAPGKIKCVLGLSNYEVVDNDGNIIHRHIDQLRRRFNSSLTYPERSKVAPETAQPIRDNHQNSDLVEAQSGPQKFVSLNDSLNKEQGAAGKHTSHTLVDASPNCETITLPRCTEAQPIPSRPIRQCRLENKARYKF